ncbi:exopolysaccharide production protein ExoF [Mesorhizobium albiziae]|uniref:Exopolysaccharide production protein ExoF n=1 Tax=Neomesorhizobium albiziae TaxID=335020 RepID=A0A1I4ELL6_9HYPH|nr:exopolysaccharide production protein ExoF [Mesorhizobium albiziae]
MPGPNSYNRKPSLSSHFIRPAACSARAYGIIDALVTGSRQAGLRVLLLATFLLATCLQSSLADSYRLSPYDKIDLRVVEWRQGEAEYKEWEALTGTYAISDGNISVPLVGEILVEGKTIGEVSKEIAERLQGQTGLLNAPSVSVNIASHGSIYVMGDVQNPGEFPYSTNMTVLQAVTVAGGLRRKVDAAFMRLDRDRIAAAGELEEAELAYTRMLVRQARLEAELEEKNDFGVPVELSDHPKASGIAKEEHGFMAARNSMLRSKLDTLVDLQALNEQEIVTLDDKIKSQHVQIELAKKELKGVTSLREKGLAVTSRQMALQRELADAESKLLDLEIALVRSKQALKKAERDGEDLRSTHLAEIEKDLQEVRPKLEQAKVQMRTAALLVNEATVTTPAILEAREKNAVRSEPTFAVVREVKGWPKRISADAYSTLRPRDIVEVVIVDAPNAGQSLRIPPGN